MSKRTKPPAGCYWRGGVLWGRLKVKGTEIRWSLRTRDAKLAASRREERRRLAIGAAHFGETRQSYEGAFEAWASWIVDQVAETTVKRYATSLKQLEPDLQPLYLDELTNRKLSEIITRRRQIVSVATIRRDLTALSNLLDFAETEGWHEGNAALSHLRRLRERRDPIVLPDVAHLERVIARAPATLGKLIRALRATGCRLDELGTARRSQLDRARRELTVYGKGKKGQGKKTRVIDLVPFGGVEIFDELTPYLAEPWLFWHHNGRRYRNLSSRLSAIVEAEHQAAIAAAGENSTPDFRPFTMHEIRHLHAVEWLQSGRSIYDLQKRLGHASIKTTEIYLAFLTPEQERLVKFGAQSQEQTA